MRNGRRYGRVRRRRYHGGVYGVGSYTSYSMSDFLSDMGFSGDFSFSDECDYEEDYYY